MWYVNMLIVNGSMNTNVETIKTLLKSNKSNKNIAKRYDGSAGVKLYI